MNTRQQVIVFASEGVVRAVAVRSAPAEEVPCIVVDYDERAERREDVSPEDFEREKLGVDRAAFDQTATYIW